MSSALVSGGPGRSRDLLGSAAGVLGPPEEVQETFGTAAGARAPVVTRPLALFIYAFCFPATPDQ